ncbi:hypothetical protein NONI108955_05995 [Nocardia ninae]
MVLRDAGEFVRIAGIAMSHQKEHTNIGGILEL